MAATRRLTPFAGASLAFGSVAAGYTNIVAGVAGRGVLIVITNSLDVDCWISLDGGTTNFVQLPATVGITLDLATNDAEFSGAVAVKRGSGAPTSGFISVGVLRVL